LLSGINDIFDKLFVDHDSTQGLALSLNNDNANNHLIKKKNRYIYLLVSSLVRVILTGRIAGSWFKLSLFSNDTFSLIPMLHCWQSDSTEMDGAQVGVASVQNLGSGR